MKNLFKNLMLVAVAAMAFTACTETNEEVNANVEKRVFKFIAGFADDTRSGFLEKEEGAKAYKSEWFGDETLKVYANGVAKDVEIEDAEGHFSVELTGNPTHINVYSPASAWSSEDFPTIPAEQTPSANSVDPAAHILKAQGASVNSGVVTMSHAVAYGKMTVNAPSTFAISYVEVSFKGGDVYTIKADNVENNTFWFATKPAEVSEFTVKAYNAEGKAVAKIVDVAAQGKTLAFNVGKVSTFSVSGLKAVVEQSSSDYTLVTDASTLAVGDKVIIVANDKDAAMSTTQNNNNRAKVDVTKNGNTIAYVDGIQILTLEAGTKTGTFAFNTGNGYLYAASSSSNHLKTQATNNDNGSWSITIADGIATVKAQGSNSNNWMRYNSTNNPPIFSCYGKGQTDICIYKQGTVVGGDIVFADPLFELDVTELSFKADGESKEVNVIPLNYFEAEVTVTTDADWLTIENNDGYKYTVTAKENNGDVREAVITFKSGDISHDVAVAQAASVNNATEVTVAEFLAAKEDDVTLYRLRGTITGMYQNNDNDYKYGNFYLTDDTGTVLIYGLYGPENTPQYWADSGAEIGDDIEIITVRTSYGSTPQGKNAIFVEKQRPGTIAFWSFDKTSASFGYEGGEAEIKVDAYNLKADVEWEFEDGAMFDAYYDKGVVYVTAYENEDEEAYEDILYVTCGDLSQEIALTLAAKPGEGGGAEAPKTYTLQFGSTYNSKGQSSYANSWYVTCDGFIWDIVNANNNNNGWNYIKIGSKNAAYVGKITTRNVMPETIKTVTMSVSAITTSSINSIKLYVATDSAFSKDVQTISVTPNKGDLIFNIPTPTANCFYKIEVDCQKAGSNGPISITKVVYTNN